jgi:uncharacterized protein (DUF58 family)
MSQNLNNKGQNKNRHPAIANLSEMVKLRYAARELTSFPRVQARQMMAGGHRSRFRGRGMDFDEVRIYQPGDDVRSIDWRVTAKTQTPHTKIFREERERPVLVVSDLRSSMFFGSQRLKSVVACEISAALAWAGLNANDRVGGLVFGAQKQAEVKSRRSHHAVLQFIHELQDFSQQLLEPSADQHSLAHILEEARRFSLPGTTIFIVSDFHDFDQDCERHLFELARHGNLNFCHVFDSLETELPAPALYAVSDGERQTLLDTSNNRLREEFANAFEARNQRLKKFSQQLSAGLLPFNTADSVMSVLAQAYGKRRKGRRS